MNEILSGVLHRTSPAELICVTAYSPEDKVFYMGDGYLGVVLNLGPAVGADEDTAEKLATILRLQLPPNSFISFMLYASPDLTRHTGAMVNQRLSAGLGDDSLFVQSKRSEAAYYEKGVLAPIEKVNGTKTRDFRSLVTIKIPLSNGSMPTDLDVKTTTDFAGRLQRGLEQIGMRGSMMTADQYVQFMGTIFNRSPNASWRTHPGDLYDDAVEINKQLFDFTSEVSVTEGGFSIGQTHVRSLSTKKLPKFFTIGAVQAYIADVRTSTRGVTGSFMITVNICYVDAHKEKEALQQKRQYNAYQAFGPIQKFVPAIAQQKDSFDVLFESIDAGDMIVRICPSFFVFENSEEEASRSATNMATYYSELGFLMQEDRYISLPLFINALPLCADPKAVTFLERYNTLTTKHAAQFLPICADWDGSGTTHAMTFVSRTGQLMSIDLFDSSTNYNAVIAAMSGSGKSFLTNYLTVSYQGLGARVWVIDVGRSYLKLCQILGGQFIEFSPESNVCLNPFPLIEDYSEEADTIIGLLAAMACPGDDQLDGYQISRLKEYVMTGWNQYGKTLTIDDIAESLKSDDDERVRDIGHRMYAFTSGGEYGKYFVGENNINFDNPFCVLELEELKSKPHLQQVVLLQLIYQIQQAMYLGDLGQRKILVIDEAWDLLKHGRIAAFIEGGYRRFRKYNGAAIVVTQSVFDLYKDAAGKAIAENSANMFLLGQKRDVVVQLEEQRKLDLSPGAFEVLKTVASQSGHYSEVFFYMDGGRQYGIGRLIVDRFAQLLFTTKADEVALIRRNMQSGMSVTEAINAVIELEKSKRGVA